MIMNPESLLETIKSLPLKDALSVLVAQKIVGFADMGMDRIKQIIQDKFNEKTFAFVPDKDEAKQLVQLGQDPSYETVKMLIPSYRHLDLIRTGLLIHKYHESGTKKARERVSKIKKEILMRPNGKHLLKIVNLPTTPFFKIVVEYLFHLKTEEGYTVQMLEEAFDEIVSMWQKTSMFFKSGTTKKDVVDFCRDRITKEYPVLFLLGMKSVSETIEHAIQILEKEGYFTANGYKYRITKQTKGAQPRTEVMIVRRFF